MSEITPAGSYAVAMLTGDSVVRVPADATLADVARALADGELGAVIVGDEDRPAAIVSERDIVRAVATGRDPASTPALDLASTELVWCDVEATVDEVAGLMMDRYVRHVLVEDESGELVGIVSARDLLGVYGGDADADADFDGEDDDTEVEFA